jgi:anionic cell wall polymer biosynthesis LytR-Cps2A-Psr (LCP) family protein
MKRFSIDKSSALLIVILCILVAMIVFLAVSLRSDAVDLAMKSDRILNIAVIIEKDGKPTSTQLFLFYPSNGRGALLDVPGETGLIIKSLNRVDRIDVLYDKRSPRAYINEIAGPDLLATSIPYWIILDEKGLTSFVDILEGIEVFVPSQVDLPGPPRVSIPSGALTLDGDKTAQFAFYKDPDETDSDTIARRQKLFQSLVRRLGEKSTWVTRSDVFPALRRNMRTNLDAISLDHVLSELSKLDADRLILQKVTGIYREVDGKRLLFPHYDGELVRDIVKQTLNALASSGSGSSADKIFTIEILNGTPTKGLAKKAAEIFQSFGYDVISVDNADREDYDKTEVIDRFANPDASKSIADVIRCQSTSQQAAALGVVSADFTIILGKDFNGRYCASQ